MVEGKYSVLQNVRNDHCVEETVHLVQKMSKSITWIGLEVICMDLPPVCPICVESYLSEPNQPISRLKEHPVTPISLRK